MSPPSTRPGGAGEARPAGRAPLAGAGGARRGRAGARHRIAVLALEAVVPLDLAIPAQVFGTYDEAPYTVTVCSASPVIRTTAGFTITAQAGLPPINARMDGACAWIR